MAQRKQRSASPAVRTSWDPLAEWYDGWVGKHGSQHHRKLAIPILLDLLDPQPDEQILDLGAGQGVLAPHIARRRAGYTGIDVSPKLLHLARRYHSRDGRFIQADARRLAQVPELRPGTFDGVTFLLSIQDMDPLDQVLGSAAWALRSGGRLVILMTHPCFRIPRQSGWGWDEGRSLRYRRVDHYLTGLSVPMKAYPGEVQGVTLSFHRPLQEYVNGLAACGLVTDRLCEAPTCRPGKQPQSKGSRRKRAERRADAEIPLFLGLRAVKVWS